MLNLMIQWLNKSQRSRLTFQLSHYTWIPYNIFSNTIWPIELDLLEYGEIVFYTNIYFLKSPGGPILAVYFVDKHGT